MKTQSLIFVIFVIFLITKMLHSQDCNNYYQHKCEKSRKLGYSIHPKSQNNMLSYRDTLEVTLTLIAGKDYKVSYCTEKNLSGLINLQIYDQQKRLFFESFENHDSEIEFTVKKDQLLHIMMFLTQPVEKEKICTGLLIEYMITPKTGF